MKGYTKYLALFLLPLFLSFDNPDDKYFEIAKNMEIYSSVFKEINKYYVEGVEPSDLMKKGIDAMLASLDPYTNYIAEEDIEGFRMMTTGEYGGVGAMIGTRDNRVLVLQPYEGFPADKAGLKLGDELLQIDSVPTSGKSSSEISKLLRGQANTELSLKVKRYGIHDTLSFVFKRGKVKVKSVPYYGMIDQETGYFILTSFTETASSEVLAAVKELKKQGAKRLVFDLRNNGGGLLNEAVAICNIFIPKGEVVVTTKGKVNSWNKTYQTRNEAYDTQIPLVVLINGMSASASEIVSGVLQDYDRAVVVGENSYGKGLVQSTFNIPYNAKVKITTAKYYTPSGRCIQEIDYSHKDNKGAKTKNEFKTRNGRKVFDGKGIAPDVVIKDDSISDVVSSLYKEDVLLDYALHNILESKEKVIDVNKIDDFVTWYTDKEYNKTLNVTAHLDQIEDFIDNGDVIASVKKIVEKRRQEELIRNKVLIINEVNDIIQAYHYYKPGKIRFQLSHDKNVNEAIELLSDTTRYYQLLK